MVEGRPIIQTFYVSAGCNPVPNCLDSANGTILYGSSTSVAEYNFTSYGEVGGVTQVLGAHTQRVNCVRVIRDVGATSGNSLQFVSCAADNTTVLWHRINEKWEKKLTLDVAMPGSSVNAVDGINHNGSCYIACGSSDGSLTIWRVSDETNRTDWSQTINCGRGFVLDLRLSYIRTSGDLLLICCGDDGSVNTYCKNLDRDGTPPFGQFNKSQSLIGHKDWVRSVDIHEPIRDQGSEQDTLMATSSEDIRIWKLRGTRFEIESVLNGHEAWVYSVRWTQGSGRRLLSASFDQTAVIWGADKETGIWIEQVRVGLVSASGVGFTSATWCLNQKAIIACDHKGALHLFRDNGDDDWRISELNAGGHEGEVVDMAWEGQGRYLLTAGVDQTTRVHAPVGGVWKEVCRPQVHGYDMAAVVSLGDRRFVSGADEKVIRIFDAPSVFLSKYLDVSDSSFSDNNQSQFASVPALGLSNKADLKEEPLFSQSDVSIKDMPGIEANLSMHTLWPERRKLYGHGYEIYCLAVSHCGRILLSACKATTKEHATILVWQCAEDSWEIVSRITHHNLTVTQMSFSPSDQRLLTVSRDRTWAVFDNHNAEFRLKLSGDGKKSGHSRIIWTGNWSHDGRVYATGGRDKRVCVWSGETEVCEPLVVIGTEEGVMSLDFAPGFNDNRYLMAIGLENGVVLLYSILHKEASLIISLCCHRLSIKIVSFRPYRKPDSDHAAFELATCGLDGHTKLHRITL